MVMTARLVSADNLLKPSMESSQQEGIYINRTLVHSEHEVLLTLIHVSHLKHVPDEGNSFGIC
jgi:hypothetical protein